MNRVAQTQFFVRQNLAPERIQYNVLTGGKKRQAPTGRQSTADDSGGLKAYAAKAASNPACVSSIHPRRRPKTGSLTASISGDHKISK